jgi:23S rRNA pseudouridine1911/1915/1917 synthase
MMKGQRQLHVTPDQATTRLDHFLSAELPDLTRSQIKRLIDEGSVTLDEKVAKAGYKLRGGETICVCVAEPAPVQAEAEAIPLTILYEDADLIVIDKPAGMVVHPAPGHHQGTLVNALLHHCHDLSGIGGQMRPGIVHRLDKNTSGVMVATKNDNAHNCLARQFKSHTIERRYRALVHGVVQCSEGKIDKPIGRHPVQRKKMTSKSRAGRHAVTHWRVLRRYDQEKLTLLDLTLETGRTHQIRVHLAEMNLPVVGDPLYGSNRKARGISDLDVRTWVETLDRQFLHAWCLGFTHPDGRKMTFRSPLPVELRSIIDYLEQKYGCNPDDLAVQNSRLPTLFDRS